MITHQTTLVLGAGASAPYGYLTGKKLMEYILQNTLNTSMLRMYARLNYERLYVEQFIDALRKSFSLSIDEFLEHRSEYRKIGKFAIASALITSELENGLYTDDWYQLLFHNMNTSFEDFDQNKLSVITFNYDRSFEEFLITALMNKFGKSESECYEKMSTIPIVHVHGKLGNLPWERKGYTRKYSPVADINDLIQSSDGIRIIHENSRDDDSIFNEAHKLLQQAENIYFLGFGYHKLNLDRLKINLLIKDQQNIMGSCFGMTGKEIEKVRDGITEGRIKLINHTGNEKILEFLRNNVILE